MGTASFGGLTGSIENMSPTHQINTIADYHRLVNLPGPRDPLISILRFEDMKRRPGNCSGQLVHHFYSIAFKKNVNSKLKYGGNEVDFDKGVMHFMSPGQELAFEISSEEEFTHTGWLMLIHPDFLLNSVLSARIRQYPYFSYRVNEALFLSADEETMVLEMFSKISKEYFAEPDAFTRNLLIDHITLLLSYCDRFYERQFINRKEVHHHLVDSLGVTLDEYFQSGRLVTSGIPTVDYLSRSLHISPGYLSRLLRLHTGQSTKHFINDRLLQLAKEKLSAPDLTISEIAYELGFVYPQSFGKFFRQQTGVSPVEFRKKRG